MPVTTSVNADAVPWFRQNPPRENLRYLQGKGASLGGMRPKCAIVDEDRSYTEIIDAIRAHCHAPTADARALWRIAPAFGINPFPDKDRESKTWLSERDGPITDVAMQLARASYFALDEQQALTVLGEVYSAVSNWRQVVLGLEVGLQAVELDDFVRAFEYEQMDAAAVLLGRYRARRTSEIFAVGWPQGLPNPYSAQSHVACQRMICPGGTIFCKSGMTVLTVSGSSKNSRTSGRWTVMRKRSAECTVPLAPKPAIPRNTVTPCTRCSSCKSEKISCIRLCPSSLSPSLM